MNSRFSSGAAEELEALPANGLRPPWYGLVWLANGLVWLGSGLVWLGSGFMCVAPPARCIVAPPGCAIQFHRDLSLVSIGSIQVY
jgi:hypothetical protein